MMKVGILTFHNAINYGAVLQAYALQQVLKKMSVDCEIIDYLCPGVEKQYRRKKLSDHAHWKVYIMDLLSGHRLDKKKAEFAAFFDKCYVLSEKTEPKSCSLDDKYDAIIVGSDQVFNPKNTEGDSTYLLDFECNAKKIAYAASIGDNSFLDLWKEKYGVDYISLLKKFDSLSFREEEAASFVSELLNIDCKTVLDPVLLAGNEVWGDFCEKECGEYVFVYNLGNIPQLAECTKAIGKKTGLKVYVVNRNIKGDYMFHEFENVSSLSPTDFLKMLSGAKYVITDSFHGTAFSVLFHKNFYSVISPNKVNANSRIIDLLKRIKLNNRIISDPSEIKYDPISTYSEVDEEILRMQKSSLNWLKDVLHIKEK